MTLVAALVAALVGGCGSGGSGAAGEDAGSTADVGAGGPDTSPEPVSCEPVELSWPIADPPPSLTPHESWKTTFDWTYEPFAVGESFLSQWVKFTILTADPSRVIFQDGNTYAFHYEFATERLDPFIGLSVADYEAVSLHSEGQQAITGAILIPGERRFDEVGIQLAGEDPYPAELVADVIERVMAAVETDGVELRPYYMPTWTQSQVVHRCADRFAALGVEISSPERWTFGDTCYAQGWAIGTLRYVPTADIEAAFESGTLTAADILLTDGVPADLPPLAGVVALEPASPNSHVAILSKTFGIPFVHVSREEQVATVQALVGQLVSLDATPEWQGGSCYIRIASAEHIGDELVSELLALKEPAELAIPAYRTKGQIAVSTEGLGADDIVYTGGKAANFGMLREVLPDNSPVSIALTFDLWDAFMAQTLPEGDGLGERIAGLMAEHTWPPDLPALYADLATIRDLIEVQPFGDAEREAVIEALSAFDATRRLRFRSSTNVEDSDRFTGAGLYESRSGCLADDTDDDDQGPSLCDSSKEQERGVFRAIRKVYASFYGPHAVLERLRHGVDESDVGMALLVHHSFPDALEQANGVAVSDLTSYSPLFEIASQQGATSVANPEPGVMPEIAHVRLGSGYTTVDIQQYSSLLPIGASVLSNPDEYEALGGMFQAVTERWWELHDGPVSPLDFEFKKFGEAGDLIVKQVRAIPPRSDDASVTTFLLDQPTELCTFQGETGDVFGLHHLKGRWQLSAEDRWLDGEGLSSSLYRESSFTYAAGGERRSLEGAPSSWPDASFEAVQGNENFIRTYDVYDGFVPPELGGSVRLLSRLPVMVPAWKGPIATLDSLEFQLLAVWDSPRPTTSGEMGLNPDDTTTEHMVRLAPCTHEDEVTQAHELQSRAWETSGGVAFDIEFYWPPGPRGPTGGYTAPLFKWVGTTITGLTSSPIVLTDWYAQTYSPEHHNFSEHFLFEPRLDPGVDATTLAELEAANIAQIYVYGDLGGQMPFVSYAVGLDGSLTPID